MRLIYPGPYSAVDVPGVGTVEQGDVIDVPHEKAESLLEQGWQRPRRPKPKRTTPTTTTEEA